MQNGTDCNTGRAPLVLSRRKIAASIRKQTLKPDEREQLAAYVELACRRHDWNEDARREELPAYEVALATVVVLEALLRRLDNRMRNGRLRATGFEPQDAPRGPVLLDGPAPAVNVLPYVEPEFHEPKPPAPIEEPGEHEYAGDKDQRGFKLGNIVDPGDELSWYWGQSALELGYTSTYDAMVTKVASHGAVFVHQDPVGPNELAINAARRQAEVMQAMRKVPRRLQAVLEAAYTDRRYRQQHVTTFGAGVAAIVARAVSAKRQLEQSPTGSALLALQRCLMRLTGSGRKIPDWSALEPREDVKGTLEHRTRVAATELLEAAQAAYREARGLPKPRAPKPDNKAKRLEPVPVRSLSPRRQFVEVVRAA